MPTRCTWTLFEERNVEIPAKPSDAFGYSTQIRILIQPVLFQRSNPEMISILPYSWHDWLSDYLFCNAFLKKQWILDSKALQISINLTPQVILPSFVENTRCIDLVGVGPVSTEAFNAIGRNGRSYVRNATLEDDDDSVHSDSSCNLKIFANGITSRKKKWRLCHVLSKLECLIRFFSSLHLDWTTFPASECQFQDLLKLKGQAIKPSQISPVFLSSKNHPMIQGSFTNSLQWW